MGGSTSNQAFAEQMKQRTKAFTLRVIKLYEFLPTSVPAQIIGKQLLRSSSSVSANYRAACRARSEREFAAKIQIVFEEADESAHWLKVLGESELMDPRKLSALLREAEEFVAICASIRSTLRRGDRS
jgi:four helix bundle protein